MGGHGGLNILPQKSWHVYNRDNRLQVAQDEEHQRQRDEEASARQRQADGEHRRNLLLQRARGSHASGSDAQGSDAPSAAAPTDGAAEHINFWKEEEIAAKTQHPEVLKQKRDEARARGKADVYTSDAKFDQSFQFGHGLTGGDKPWYAQAPSSALAAADLPPLLSGGNSSHVPGWALQGPCGAAGLSEQKLRLLPSTGSREDRTLLLSQGTTGRHKRRRVDSNCSSSSSGSSSDGSSESSSDESNSDSRGSTDDSRDRAARKHKKRRHSEDKPPGKHKRSSKASRHSRRSSSSSHKESRSRKSKSKDKDKAKRRTDDRRSGAKHGAVAQLQKYLTGSAAVAAGAGMAAGGKSVAELRAERLQREQADRQRSKHLLMGGVEMPDPERPGHYNSGFGYAAQLQKRR